MLLLELLVERVSCCISRESSQEDYGYEEPRKEDKFAHGCIHAEYLDEIKPLPNECTDSN